MYRPRTQAEVAELVLRATAALEGMGKASCSLRVGRLGPQRAAAIGLVLSLTRQGADYAVKDALRAAKRAGITPEGLRSLAAQVAESTE